MRRRVCRFAERLVPALAMSAAGALGWPAAAEPVTNRALSTYQIARTNSCMLLKVNFNFRVKYVSHFASDSGRELRVLIQPIDLNRPDVEGSITREAMRPPQDRNVGIKAIQYQAAIAEGPSLTILFERPFSFTVATGRDFQSIVVAVSDTKHGRGCKAEFPRVPGDDWRASLDFGETTVVRKDPVRETKVAKAKEAGGANQEKNEAAIADVAPTTAEPPADTQPAALVAQARTAFKQHNYSQAILVLKKAVAEPEGPMAPEARELLGVAYQKNRQESEGKAVYADYLRRYPNGDGSEGVRQRLMALQTAEAGPETVKSRSGGFTTISGSDEASSVNGAPPQNGKDRSFWTASGSISSFYIRDDSFRVVRDPTVAVDFNKTAEDHEAHHDTLMNSFDFSSAWGNGGTKAKFRFSGTEEHRFSEGGADRIGVGALYLDASLKEYDTGFRLGRQVRNSGGVLGRFDGLVFDYQWTPWFGVSTVAGSPVDRRTDGPFENDRYFYGGALNFSRLISGFDTSLYVIEQRSRDYVERQAVGAELRYADPTKAAFLNIDYDTYFNELDAAIFTGSWTFADQSLLRAGADYRKAPYLTIWNSLQGQGYVSLYELLKARTEAEVKQMAIDRTATYQSANIGYTRPLTEKIQLNLDVTAAYVNGTITSYGVEAIPDTGTEYFYSAQLVGTSLFRDGDLYTAALRYSDLEASENFAADVAVRFPLTEELRVQPRLAGVYRTGKDAAKFTEYSVLPSVLIEYFWTRDLSFEVEIGERWTWNEQGPVRTDENELFITAGFRYDFYADVKNRCFGNADACTR